MVLHCSSASFQCERHKAVWVSQARNSQQSCLPYDLLPDPLLFYIVLGKGGLIAALAIVPDCGMAVLRRNSQGAAVAFETGVSPKCSLKNSATSLFRPLSLSSGNLITFNPSSVLALLRAT